VAPPAPPTPAPTLATAAASTFSLSASVISSFLRYFYHIPPRETALHAGGYKLIRG
jgi:hypothetical protein